VVALAGLLAATGPAAAAPPTPDATQTGAAVRAAGFSTVFRYTFDKGESLRPGTKVRDVSGNRYTGTVKTAEGGTLSLERHKSAGRAAGFPCKSCGRAAIEVNRKRGLNPLERAFRFGADIRMRSAHVSRQSNVLQKGYYNQAGGQYKLQVDGGLPSCVVMGSAGRVTVRSARSVVDGRWHSLSCQRIGTRVVLRMDGAKLAQGVGPTGVIRNSAPVRIGAKKLAPSGDQYHGDLDNPYLKIAR
jgi:hypothetical protein